VGIDIYVAAGALRSAIAIANLEQICEGHGPQQYRIHIVDVSKNPKRCREDQIVAVPTVVRRLPLPERRVIGTLTNSEVAAEALGLSHREFVAQGSSGCEGESKCRFM
jgi:circadian clock protein KaiB